MMVTFQGNEELGEETLLERSISSPKPPLSQELSQWAAAVVVLTSILDRCRQW